ncbi:MAG: MFS transporter [Christensenellaceae bacterium]|jgi:MFS family permease|nr:MFS transporter [Christensenellaceae bacterium]
MQLNYKRTILVGLAFFSICAFWQMYDNIIPLILKNTFGLGDTISGFIMSLDNILALFMLPLFGALSDKAGRRMPFVVAGTAAAVALCVLLPFADRQASLPLFIAILGMLLIAMSTYRSPAVALMPDVTPKPLRSKANAVINLMGALGGVYTLLMVTLLVKQPDSGLPNYQPLFIAVAGIMAISVLALGLRLHENKLLKEGADETEEIAEPSVKLPREVRRSLVLILASVALWYMGYNAVTTAFTKYAEVVWGQGVGQASTCLLIATVGAVVSYIPIGLLSSRIGRKKTVLIGVVLLAGSFAAGGWLANRFSPALYGLFALVGFSWAAINVNSYPMVVEISKYGSVGKYTGYYYTFSMAAQIVTPILSGALLEYIGYHTLFPYAAICVALALGTMACTRHGDNKPPRRSSKLDAYEDMA